MQVEACMLSPAMLKSRTFHLICGPARCAKLVTDIMVKRREAFGTKPDEGSNFSKPIFVWEPMEDSCRPGELDSFNEALQHVDIFSPNGHELALLFTEPEDFGKDKLSEEVLSRHCKKLLTQGLRKTSCAVVVR